MNRAVLCAWMGMLVSGAAAFALSCRLAILDPGTETTEKGKFSIAGQTLSASRTALSGFLVEQADTDYHMGRDERHEEAFRDRFYQRIGEAIAPRHHIHLSGSSVKEMMPRIKMALISDPHNIEAYLIASFWLASPQIDRPEEARKVLLLGQSRNPRSYEILKELGVLSLKEGNLEEAKKSFEAGLRLWPGNRDPQANQTRLDKEVLLTYRALLHENDGEILPAMDQWRAILEIFPNRDDVRTRLQTLAGGKDPPVKASERWQRMLQKAEKERGACHRQTEGSSAAVPRHVDGHHNH